MIRNINTYIFISLITLTILTGLTTIASADGHNHPESVLLLNSYDQNMNWVKGITRGVSDTLNQSDRNISLRIENMDTKMISSSQYYEAYASYLHSKYKDVPFSAILASDNNAYDFLRKYRDIIFPEVPVLFCGVNFFQPEQIAHLKNFGGVEEVISFKETLRLIAEYHPKTTEVFLINDYLTTGRAWEQTIRNDIKSINTPFTIRFSQDLPIKELQHEIERLPETAVVLMGVYYADSQGYSSSYEAIGEEVAKVSKVPVYCLAEFNLNKYVVGGIVISGYSEGSAIATTALKIMRGENPFTEGVSSTGSNRAIFNFPLLKKYDIKEHQLPTNSLVLNRTFSVYEEYYYQVWLIICFIVLLLFIIIFLVINITKRKRAEQSLRKSEQNFRAFFEMASVGVAQLNIHSGEYRNVNQRFCEIVSYSKEELLGLNFIDITHPSDLHHQQEQIQLLIAGSIPEFTIEKRYIKKNGTITWAALTVTPLWGSQQEHDSVLAVIRDITAQKQAEEGLVFAKKVFDNSIEGIVVTDAEGTILQVNAAFSTITGYAATEVLGKNPRMLKSEKHSPSFYQEMWGEITTTGQWAGETWNRRKNGEAYPEWLTINAVKDKNDTITNFVSIFHDISQHVEQQEVIQYQAQHDALTGLPNRALINERLEQALEKAHKSHLQVALLYLDIDNFKYINDAFGHVVGDDILVELSQRFSSLMGKKDSIARLGGDDFLVLLTEVSDLNMVNNIAMQLFSSLEQPFQHGGVEFFVTASVGVTIAPDDGTDPVTLVKNSDVAMYRAKNIGKNNYQYFAPELDVHVHRRIALEMELRKSIEREEFELYYQPLVDSVSGEIVSAEALIRWKSNGEIISPAEFIPLAEDSGLILPLGEWVLRTAARQAKQWQEAGHKLKVSVNISSKQFAGQDLFTLLEKILSETNLEPELLYLEVTESMILDDLTTAQRLLGALRSLGVKIYLDDFGTGYSSLAYLKKLPIDGLKIDRSFIKDIVDDSESEAITAVIASLATTLRLQIVAEGVENIEQWAMLNKMSRMLIQGYLISKPVPATDFEQVLARGVIDWQSME